MHYAGGVPSYGFLNGEVVEGSVAEDTHHWYEGDKEFKRDFTGFAPSDKYLLPPHWYDFFDNRSVDFGVRGSFVSDCKLCGAKSVEEQEHAMSECFKLPENIAKIKSNADRFDKMVARIGKESAEFVKLRNRR
jgi:hypothetical protein